MTQTNEFGERGSAPKQPRRNWIRRNGTACVGAALLIYIFAAAYAQSWNLLAMRRGAVLSFDGDSAGLAGTQIVPTLDTPIQPGKNAIWCATFVAGWKQAQQKVTNGPLNIVDAAEMCARLNAAPDPASTLPAEAIYSNAGTVEKGIIKTIHEDMRARFPNRTTPSFGNIAGASFVFYSYLEARAPFTILYSDNPKPLQFTGGDGEAVPVRSFGFGPKDMSLHRLMEQPRLLMATWEEVAAPSPGLAKLTSFAVDLCHDSRPYQVVVARVPRKETLAAMLDALAQDIKAFETKGEPEILRGALRVPNMFWRLSHHFRELEGQSFSNPDLANLYVATALQEIQFRLDRTGVEVVSAAKASAVNKSEVDSRSRNFVFDGPFLALVKRRDEAKPFIAVWIENAELLQRWGGGGLL